MVWFPFQNNPVLLDVAPWRLTVYSIYSAFPGERFQCQSSMRQTILTGAYDFGKNNLTIMCGAVLHPWIKWCSRSTLLWSKLVLKTTAKLSAHSLLSKSDLNQWLHMIYENLSGWNNILREILLLLLIEIKSWKLDTHHSNSA